MEEDLFKTYEPAEEEDDLSKLTAAQKFSKKFSKKRQQFNSEIGAGVKQLIDIKKVNNVQVEFLGIRQRLVEENQFLLENYVGIKRKITEAKAKAAENLSNNSNYLYKHQEKNAIVAGKTAELQEILDMFENQIRFFEESIKTTDSVLFGTKNRIEVEKLLGI